ncbi:hypothetical protein FCJ48_18920 [Salmonella enterica]|nr:hypothetical protein [Salmonella enterica]
MFKFCSVVLATLMAFCSLTYTNMRAPGHINHAPSSSLTSPGPFDFRGQALCAACFDSVFAWMSLCL